MLSEIGIVSIINAVKYIKLSVSLFEINGLYLFPVLTVVQLQDCN